MATESLTIKQLPNLLRAGGFLIVFFETVYLAAHFHYDPSGARSTFAFHVLNVLIGFFVLGMTLTSRLLRHWHWFTLLTCSLLMVSTTLIAGSSGSFEFLFVTVLAVVVGVGTLVPWSGAWQGAVSVAGVTCYLALTIWHPGEDLSPVLHWLALATGVVLAHSNVFFQTCSRRDVWEHVCALQESHERLHAQVQRNEMLMAEQEAAHRKLKQSEETLRQVFDASFDVITVVDEAEGNILEVNRQFERFTAATREQVVGQRAAEVVEWLDPQRKKEFARELFAAGSVHNLEARVRLRGGPTRDALISGARLALNGKPCIATFGRDITDLKIVQRQLRASEESFRRILESEVDMVLVGDLESGRLVEVNDQFVKTMGIPRDEAIGKSSAELGFLEKPGQREEYFVELKRRGYVPGMEMQGRTRTGAIIPLLVSAAIIEIDGRPGYMGVARDISKLKQAEQKLRESEEKFRLIFEKTVDLVIVSSLKDGRVVEVNPQFVLKTGFAREEVVGKDPVSLNLWLDPEQRGKVFSELKERGFIQAKEIALRSKQGGVLPLLVSLIVVPFNGEQCAVSFARDISKLKQAEHELRQSEATLRKIVDSSVDSLVLAEARGGRFVHVNPEFLSVTGFSREETAGRNCVEIGLWPDVEEARQFARAVRMAGMVRNLETNITCKDGRTVPVLISAVLVDIAGRQCILSAARDISDRKEAEQKLRNSQLSLRKTFDSITDPLSIMDMATRRYIDVNDEFLRVSGFSRGEVIGRTSVELGIWSDLRKRDEIFALTNTKAEFRNFEATFRVKDGTEIPVLMSSVSIELGGRRCTLTIRRDISERKEAERRLRASQLSLRKTFDSILDPISITDIADRRYIDVNDEFLRMSGFSREEVIGRTYDDLNLLPDQNKMRELRELLARNGEARNFEAPFRIKDGTEVPVLISAVVIELGGRRCVLLIRRDIGQLKRTENELRAAREAALATSRAKSEFLSSMSHEIRTPMNAILGMADLLWETALTSEQRRYLDTVIWNGNALLDLINSILDLARIESGRLSLESTDFDLVDLTEKVADSLAPRAHEKGLELVVHFAPDVPGALVGDPLRLRQILINLLGNAIKFTERGEVVITVKRDPDRDTPGLLLFSVKDTGIGIPAEKLPTIFSAFTQVDSSTTREYGGSGLGLAIVDRLVALMGGRLWVESEPGKGSTFHFTAKFGVQERARPPRPALIPDLFGQGILIVDDNRVNRVILREMLVPLKAAVSEAGCAREGIEAIAAAHRTGKPFKLLLVDCRMPEMDGFEMVRELRQRPEGEDLVIMMLSSNELNTTLTRMRQMGLNHYMVKPVKRRELYAAISETLAQATSAPEPTLGATSNLIGTRKSEARVLEQAVRILLADDSPENRLLVKAYLKRTPYLLDEAENGQAAFDKFTAGDYDVVIMDIQMPVLDGYAATRMIRHWEAGQHHTHTPIIALTASALEDAIRRAKDAGCDFHVSKPVRKTTLLEAIARAAEMVANARRPANRSKEPNGRLTIEVDPDLKDIVSGFIEQQRADVHAILKAIARDDFATIAALAHKAKGEGAGYGLALVSKIGAEIEQAASNNDAETIRHLAHELSKYLATVEVV